MATVRQEFLFLNSLRESGRTNMFGAAPFLEEMFQLDRREARKILMAWMQWVNENPLNLEK